MEHGIHNPKVDKSLDLGRSRIWRMAGLMKIASGASWCLSAQSSRVRIGGRDRQPGPTLDREVFVFRAGRVWEGR